MDSINWDALGASELQTLYSALMQAVQNSNPEALDIAENLKARIGEESAGWAST